MWSYDGLETLNEAWAEEATDEAERARLSRGAGIQPGLVA